MSNIFDQVSVSFSYQEFKDTETENLNIPITGNETRDNYKSYSVMNLKRMNRVEKTFNISESLQNQLDNLKEHQTWWVITEMWCGDSAQNLPAIAKIAEASKGKINLKIILRDDYLEIMDNYLTNGGRSIPKLIAFNEQKEELFQWGPRPQEAQKLMTEWKENPGEKTQEEMINEMHVWYPKNNGAALTQEFIQLFEGLK